MFTDNGTVLYQAVQPAFIEWRPSNDVLRDFALAMITTIISFQSTAALLDLTFGLKRRGQAAISDIQTLRLVRDASPKQIIRNTFPDTFPRYRPSGMWWSSHDPDSTPPRKSIRFTVLFRLFSLLTVIPLFNIIPLILIFEYDSTVSLREARVGNFGMGVNLNFTGESAISTSLICMKSNVEVRDRETATMDFKRCVSTGFDGPPLGVNAGAIQIIGIEAEVRVVVGTGQRTAWSSVLGYLDVDPNAMANIGLGDNVSSFGVHHSLTEESAKQLVRVGRDLLDVTLCETLDIGGVIDTSITPSTANIERFVYQENFRCSIESVAAGIAVRQPTDAKFSDSAPLELQIAEAMLKRIAFVQSNETRLVVPREENGDDAKRISNPVIVSGDGLPFLKRRRSYASFWTMVILVGVVLIVRVVGKLFTRNDLEVGVGLILRHFLGLPSGDSLLPHGDLTIIYEDDEVHVTFGKEHNVKEDLGSEDSTNGNEDELA